jgi:hypothetical protein
VASEVAIGTGRIDTLAYDSVNGRPVFIEYKGPGGFGKDALIQLMDYLSWFSRDENRMAILERIIRQHKPSAGKIKPSIVLICVVADIEDRVRNAIYAIANDVKVFTYLIARDTAEKLILVPRIEVDNTDVESRVSEPTSESELLDKHPHLQETFRKLTPQLVRDGATSYTTSKSFRFKTNKIFAKLRLNKKFIQLELRVGKGAISDPEFTYRRAGESSWDTSTSTLPIPCRNEWLSGLNALACLSHNQRAISRRTRPANLKSLDLGRIDGTRSSREDRHEGGSTQGSGDSC